MHRKFLQASALLLVASTAHGTSPDERIQRWNPKVRAIIELLETVRNTTHIAALDTVDALVAPTNGPAWKIDFVNGDHFEGGSASTAAVGGYPHVTVPAGFVLGLPIGLSVIGRRRDDAGLLALGYAYEQRTRHRRSPRL